MKYEVQITVEKFGGAFNEANSICWYEIFDKDTGKTVKQSAAFDDTPSLIKAAIEDCIRWNIRAVLGDNIVGDLPEPVKKYNRGKEVSKYSYHDWFTKIAEEVFEAHKSASQNQSGKLAEGLTDVITVCVSFLNEMGYNKNGRAALYHKINQKNLKRGYLE